MKAQLSQLVILSAVVVAACAVPVESGPDSYGPILGSGTGGGANGATGGGTGVPATGGGFGTATGGGFGTATGGGFGTATGGGFGTATGGGVGTATGGSVGGGTVSKFVTDGLGKSGTWSGYLFTAAETGSTISPDAFDGAEICASGTLSADYAQWALIGWNISQPVNPDFSGGTPVAIPPGGTGVAYEIKNNTTSGLRVQIQTDESGTSSWCAEVTGAKAGGALTGTIPWASFKKNCWCTAVGAGCEGYPYPAYDGTTAIMQVAVQTYAGSDMSTTPFNFCVVNLGPAQ